jgi:hypothetical protein
MYDKKYYFILSEKEVNSIQNKLKIDQEIKQNERRNQQNNLLNYFSYDNRSSYNSKKKMFPNTQNFESESSFNLNINLKSLSSNSKKSDFFNSKEFQILSDFIWMCSFFMNYVDILSDALVKTNTDNQITNMFGIFQNKLLGQVQFLISDLIQRYSHFSDFKIDSLILNICNSNKHIAQLILNEMIFSSLFPDFDLKLKTNKPLFLFMKSKYILQPEDERKFQNINLNKQNPFLIQLLSFLEEIFKKCNIDTSCEALILISNILFSLFQEINKEIVIENYLINAKNNNSETQNFLRNKVNINQNTNSQVRVNLLNQIISYLFGLFNSNLSLMNFENIFLQISKQSEMNNKFNFNMTKSKQKSNGIISNSDYVSDKIDANHVFSSKNDKFISEFRIFTNNLLQIPLAFEFYFVNNRSFVQFEDISKFDFKEWFSKMQNQMNSDLLEKFSFLLEQCHKINQLN